MLSDAGAVHLARRVQADDVVGDDRPAAARRGRRARRLSGQRRFLDTLPIGFSNYSRFVAPWIEEALKALAIVALFAFNRIGYKLDAVISGFAIGAGFSVVENIFYLWRFPDLSAPVWMVRGLGTAVMHGTTTAVLAAIATSSPSARPAAPARRSTSTRCGSSPAI